MKITPIKVSAVKSNEWNFNQMDDHIFRSLIESIRRYGVLQPILVRNDYTIIKGQKRWLAAKEAGLEEIFAVVIETSEEEAKLLSISLSHLRGKTNEELLAGLIAELSKHFSLDEISIQTGFKLDELDTLLEVNADTEIIEPVVDDNFNVQEALDNIKEPETKYGDMWQLGKHLLLCGDATKIEDVKKLMMDDKAALVVTDPPYNVAVESVSVHLSDGRSTIINDDMPVEEFIQFLQMIFYNYVKIMKPDAAIYVFHPSSFQRDFENAMNEAGIEVRAQCIWVKNASSFGFAQYKYKHEPVFYAHIKKNSPKWYGDRKQTTVWRGGLPVDYSAPETVWEVSRGDVTKYVHPTQKPLELLEIPIKNSSRVGDIVVDLFGGSGATLMTCDQMERSCRMMELDPIFCDVIKTRFLKNTGIEPVLLTK